MLKYDHFPTRFLRTWSEGWNGLLIFTGILQAFNFFLVPPVNVSVIVCLL